MVDLKFEFQHNGGTSVNDQSIFRQMEILNKMREDVNKELYQHQYMFMEKIRIGLRERDECNSKDMLDYTKFFSILTLKQQLCQLLVNLVGTGDNEKTNKAMQIILQTTI